MLGWTVLEESGHAEKCRKSVQVFMWPLVIECRRDGFEDEDTKEKRSISTSIGLRYRLPD